MYRIRFFSSFCDSENCKSVYERLCETHKNPNYGLDKSFYFVTDETYTHAVIINTAMPSLTIPKENVIGLAFEPNPFLVPHFSPHFLEYAKRHISKYHIGDASKLPEPFVSEYAFMWHVTPPINIPTTQLNLCDSISSELDAYPIAHRSKTRLMSIMVSHKSEAPGHLYRHVLVNAILQNGLDVDIYGNGCPFYKNDPRLKGKFEDNEPYENYEFHICIENFSLPHYTSEKYTNAILWNTTPVYLGAQNPLFPELTIALSGNITEDLTTIRNILEHPEKYRRLFKKEDVRKRLSLVEYMKTRFQMLNK